MNAAKALAAATRFTLLPGSDAPSPPEHRGIARDGIRLLVASPHGVRHQVFRDLPHHLRAGDLLVINTSATLPAALDARLRDGRRVPLHVSTALDDGSWVVELRRPDGAGPLGSVRRGELVRLPGGVRVRLAAPYPEPGAARDRDSDADADADRTRLWRARPVAAPGALPELTTYLARHGRPIDYGYLDRRYPLPDYQNVYADRPGSAEMPSAGRPFTAPLLVQLAARGVTVAPVVLHCQVSSPQAHEPPLPERYDVPQDTARLVRSAVGAGRRVVAVGTTVVRALEAAAGSDGRVRSSRGWTDLVLGPQRPARVVTGLVTGLHAPGASHLLLLEAVAGPALVRTAYDGVLSGGYLWHEFGDSMLLLP